MIQCSMIQCSRYQRQTALPRREPSQSASQVDHTGRVRIQGLRTTSIHLLSKAGKRIVLPSSLVCPWVPLIQKL